MAFAHPSLPYHLDTPLIQLSHPPQNWIAMDLLLDANLDLLWKQYKGITIVLMLQFLHKLYKNAFQGLLALIQLECTIRNANAVSVLMELHTALISKAILLFKITSKCSEGWKRAMLCVIIMDLKPLGAILLLIILKWSNNISALSWIGLSIRMEPSLWEFNNALRILTWRHILIPCITLKILLL